MITNLCCHSGLGRSLSSKKQGNSAIKKRQRNNQGFSLIELLVVVLIIGFGIGVVAVNIGVNDGDVRQEAKQFANLTALVAQEAILTNRQWGVDLFRDIRDGDDAKASAEVFGYRWLQRVYWTPPKESEQIPKWIWLPVQAKDMEAEYYFSSQLSLLLSMEDIERDIENKVQVQQKPELQQEVIKPDILLLANGEISPFVLTLQSREGDQLYHRISGDLLGRIALDIPEDD